MIPSGQASATVTVTPINDTFVEGTETVILTLSSHASYTLGATTSATVNIADDDRSTVTIVASDTTASESAGNPGQFTVSRSGSTASTLLRTCPAAPNPRLTKRCRQRWIGHNLAHRYA